MTGRISPAVTLAVYLLLFSVAPGVGPLVQLAAIGVLWCDAAWRLGRRTIAAMPPGPFELALLAAGLLSMFVGAFGDNVASYSYSLIFLVAVGALMLVARAHSLAVITGSITAALVLMVVTVVGRDGLELVQILMTGSHRFWPFGLHPDLTGFVFGGAAVVLLRQAATGNRWRRLGLGALALTSFWIVLAASARAGLIAATATLAGWWAIRAAASHGVGGLLVRLAAVAGVAAVVLPVAGAPVYRHFGALLDLESTTRGWGSGATGRLETWSRSVGLLFSGPGVMFFGLGLRTAAPQTIGFGTESSYLNILLESGLVVGGGLLLAIVGVAGSAWRSLALPKLRGPSEIVLLTVVYCLLQSVFNRYLIAIGNPLSLALLLLLVKVSAGEPSPVMHGVERLPATSGEVGAVP